MSIQFFNENGTTWTVREQGLYSDTTPMVKVGEDFYNDLVQRATGVEIKCTSILELFTGLAFVSGISRSGGSINTLILPYIPGARQDRVNPSGDVLDTLAVVADMINAQQFARVVVADPHSPAALSRIKRGVAYPLADIYKRLWQGYGGVIAPDKGGVLRASIASDTLGVPLVKASKTRDVSTGKLTGFEVDVEAGKHYLIVDDLCDGGGTFAGLMEKITEQGAFADLYVTHGLFSKGLGPLTGFRNVITTDTVDTHFEGGRLLSHVNILDRMRVY